MANKKIPPSEFSEYEYITTANNIQQVAVAVSHQKVLERMQYSFIKNNNPPGSRRDITQEDERARLLAIQKYHKNFTWVFDWEKIKKLQDTAKSGTIKKSKEDDNTKDAVELLLQATKNYIPSTHLQHAKELLGDQGVAKLINPKLFEFLTKDTNGQALTIKDDCDDPTRRTIIAISKVENAYQGLHEALQEYLTNSATDEGAGDKLREKEETLKDSIESLYTDQTNSGLKCSNQLSGDLARFLERDRAEALLSLLQPLEDKLPKWNPWAELPRLKLNKGTIAKAHKEWPTITVTSTDTNSKLSCTIGTNKRFSLPDLNHLEQKQIMDILLAFIKEHETNLSVKVKIWDENGKMKFRATDTTPNNGGQIIQGLFDKFKPNGHTLAANTGDETQDLNAVTADGGEPTPPPTAVMG